MSESRSPQQHANVWYARASRETNEAARAFLTLRGAIASAEGRPDDDFVYLTVGRDWARDAVQEPGVLLLGDLRRFMEVVSGPARDS